MKINAKGEIEIKRHNKVAVLAKLSEILGLTNAELNVNLSIADSIEAARARAAEGGEGTE